MGFFFFSTVIILYGTIMVFGDASKVLFFSLLKEKCRYGELELSSDKVLK